MLMRAAFPARFFGHPRPILTDIPQHRVLLCVALPNLRIWYERKLEHSLSCRAYSTKSSQPSGTQSWLKVCLRACSAFARELLCVLSGSHFIRLQTPYQYQKRAWSSSFISPSVAQLSETQTLLRNLDNGAEVCSITSCFSWGSTMLQRA